MDNSVYREIKIEGKKPDLSTLSAVAACLSDSLLISDDSDFAELPLSDAELRDFPVSVSLYFGIDEDIAPHIAFLEERLGAAGVSAEIHVTESHASDYADTWKAYYKPQHFESFTIVPAWESYEAAPGETVIYMDPGQVFGAGTHETTRLALRLMEGALQTGDRLLDVGTGSGILSIVAWKLAKASVTACDLDPDAVENARENMERNGVREPKTYASDLLSAVPVKAHDIVVANMVSGLLLRLLPTLSPYLGRGGRLILSGIIDGSLTEVTHAAEDCGFRILKHERMNDWNGLLAEKIK